MPDLDRRTHEYTDDELASIQDFSTALAAAQSKGNVYEAEHTLGTGFKILEEKDHLVGVPFVVLRWRFHNGNFGPFVSAEIVTENNGRYILNDGSTGIYQQLKAFGEKTGQNGGLLVKGGLTRSDYEYKDEKGRDVPATTFYLSTSG